MASQSPNRSKLHGKRILLIDRCQATREVRAAVLRTHGVEVREAEEISAARFLWQPHVYDLVMLDVRRYSPGEALEFYEQMKDALGLMPDAGHHRRSLRLAARAFHIAAKPSNSQVLGSNLPVSFSLRRSAAKTALK